MKKSERTNRKKKTAATKQDSKPRLVPKLRFPEFDRNETWEEKPLREAAQINPPNNGLPESFVYIDLESVEAGKLTARTHVSRNGAPSRAQRVVKKGDIIYQVVRPYQRNNLLCEFEDEQDYVASTGYAQLRAIGSNRFLYQSLHTHSFVCRVMEKCTGLSYPAINSSDLSVIELPLPSTLDEQQKIAECLSSVDELINAQSRKVDALRTYKKGLMQRLFPREGETQPRLRFPEFRNAEQWENNRLRAICERIMDGTHFSPKTKEGPRPYLTSKNIRMGWLDLSTVSYISDEEHQYIYARCPVKKYDVLLTKDGANTGNCAINTIDHPFSLLSSVAVLRGDSNKVTQPFLYHSIASDNMQSKIVDSMSGQAITRITLEKLGSYAIRVPSVSEQQRIAACLTSLDALITAENQKLEALKTHKKGLMQQLFPSPEEPNT
jgi:type I restriction enzyme, S subunit